SSSVTFVGNGSSKRNFFAFCDAAQADGSNTALEETPRQTSVIPAAITGGDERVVAKMTDQMAASQVGLGRLYEEGEGDVAAGQLAVAEAQNPHNGSLKSLPGNLQMIYPADSVRISSTFGMRGNPTAGGTQFHVGTDFTVPTGTPVISTDVDTVILVCSHSTDITCDA